MLIANMAMSDLLYPTFLFPVLLAKMHFGSWFVGGTLGQALCKLHVFVADCSVSEPGSDSSGSVWSCCKSTSLPSGHSIGSTVQSSFVATWIVAMAVFSPCFLAYKLVEYPGGMRCSSLTESEGKKTIMCPLTNLPSKFVCGEKYNVRQGRYTRGVLLPGMLQSHFARVSTHEGAFSSSLNLPRELAPKYLTG